MRLGLWPDGSSGTLAVHATYIEVRVRRGREISAVVHFAGDLLAAGFAGADFVSVGVVDSAAVSNCGDRGGWGA
jgi:hypothetical protein